MSWYNGAACSTAYAAVCEIPVGVYACARSPPPARPPPPTGNLCLPPNDPDNYCSLERGSCYVKNTTVQTYPNAVIACKTRGGNVVAYSSYEEQKEVESNISPASYWLGIQKVGVGSPLVLLAHSSAAV